MRQLSDIWPPDLDKLDVTERNLTRVYNNACRLRKIANTLRVWAHDERENEAEASVRHYTLSKRLHKLSRALNGDTNVFSICDVGVPSQPPVHGTGARATSAFHAVTTCAFALVCAVALLSHA